LREAARKEKPSTNSCASKQLMLAALNRSRNSCTPSGYTNPIQRLLFMFCKTIV
jgi:hypothetical protein